ncbi:MAG: AAA family ATPase [Endomicrobium sp.]|nr:AAA family ATPase [Endomicrobium sp.]
MSDLERTISKVIQKASQGFRVILLNGQRQVGKSTSLKNISKKSKRIYVSLDNMKFRQLAKIDPELFFYSKTLHL